MKKLWKQNRVLLMLIIILIICFIAIVAVALTFFYSDEVDNRFKDLSEHEITSTFKNEYQEALLENEGLLKVDFNVPKRTIFVKITFDENVTLDSAKTIVANSLELFSEEDQNYYDIEFTLKWEESEFVIKGSKNAVADHISWNNNLEVKDKETDEEAK